MTPVSCHSSCDCEFVSSNTPHFSPHQLLLQMLSAAAGKAHPARHIHHTMSSRSKVTFLFLQECQVRVNQVTNYCTHFLGVSKKYTVSSRNTCTQDPTNKRRLFHAVTWITGKKIHWRSNFLVGCNEDTVLLLYLPLLVEPSSMNCMSLTVSGDWKTKTDDKQLFLAEIVAVICIPLETFTTGAARKTVKGCASCSRVV